MIISILVHCSSAPIPSPARSPSPPPTPPEPEKPPEKDPVKEKSVDSESLAKELEKISKEDVTPRGLTEEDKSILDDFLDMEPELDKVIASSSSSLANTEAPSTSKARLNPFDQLLLTPTVQRPPPSLKKESSQAVKTSSKVPLTSLPPSSIQPSQDGKPVSPFDPSSSPLKPLLGFNTPLKPMFDGGDSPQPSPVFQDLYLLNKLFESFNSLFMEPGRELASFLVVVGRG